LIKTATAEDDIYIEAKDVLKMDSEGNMELESDGSMVLTIDDNSTTTETFAFYAEALEIASLNEGGDLQIDGDLTVTGNDIKSSTAATAITLSGADVAVAGDLTVTGDDIVMTTNTDGFILVADGTNYNPVAVSGDVTIANTGAVTIAATSVEHSMLNANVISGQTDLPSGLASADELLVSDGGVIKKMDLSVLDAYLAASTTTLTNKILTAPKIVDAGFIADANGAEAIIFQTTASAVNELQLTNAATGNGVTLETTGGDNDVDLLLVAKGAGVVKADGVEVVTLSGTQTLTNKTLTAPDLGTPTALVGTNITGTATSFTASNVTTNANLTGDVTSSGNAAVIAAGVIVDADINASAAITATKIADGSVTSAEFQYIGGLTSDAQAQIDALGSRSEGNSSDMRFKKNISTVSGALEKLSKLNPVNYNWRQDEFKNKGFNDKKQWGFIAQEVEKVMPELVGVDKDDYLTLNYTGFVPLLTKAMQEQQTEIDNQQKEIDELKAQLEMIMKMMQNDMSDKTDSKKDSDKDKVVKLSMATEK